MALEFSNHAHLEIMRAWTNLGGEADYVAEQLVDHRNVVVH